MNKEPKKIRVCNSRACTVFGAERLMDKLQEETGLKPGEKNKEYDIDYCGCLGWCSNSPSIQVDDEKILFEVEEDVMMKRIESGENDPSSIVQGKFTEAQEIKDDFLGDI